MLRGKNELTHLWLFLLITDSTFRPPLARGGGRGCPWLRSGARHSRVGVQPICCSSISPDLPLPSGSGSGSPGRPISSGGRTKGGWQGVKCSRGASPAARLPSRLWLSRARGAAGALPPAPAPAWHSSRLRVPVFGQSAPWCAYS